MAGLLAINVLLLTVYHYRIVQTENRYQEQYLESAFQFMERQEEQAALVRTTHHQHLLDQMALVESICV